MTLTIGEFAPGRIDHHGMQIVALMIIILGLARWDWFGVAGTATVVFAALLFPRCLAGPYEVIDPVSRSLWFDRIIQEKPLWSAVANTPPVVVLWVGISGSILLAAVPPMLGLRGRAQPARPIIYAVAAATLVLTIGIARYVRFPFAFIPLLLPLSYQHLRQWSQTADFRPYNRSLFIASLLLPVLAVQSANVLMPSREPTNDAADYMAFDERSQGDFSVINKVAPGRIMAPQGLSLRLAEVLPDGYSVGAVPFHRASPGIRRALEFFILPDAHGRKLAIAPFDYVAICRFPLMPERGEAPVYATLASGNDWPGLIRVTDKASNAFQLFKVDHANIR
jgi:hypothetical protein